VIYLVEVVKEEVVTVQPQKKSLFQGERVTAVSIQAIEFSLPKISGIKTYATVEESIPEFRNRKIKPRSAISFDEKIYFKTRSNEFVNSDLTEKTLNDLIMTLKEYPQLKIHIEGNISFDSKSEASRASIEEINYAKSFQSSRAKAIKDFLTKRGINAKRISTGSGKIKFEGSKGRTTTFKLINE